MAFDGEGLVTDLGGGAGGGDTAGSGGGGEGGGAGDQGAGAGEGFENFGDEGDQGGEGAGEGEGEGGEGAEGGQQRGGGQQPYTAKELKADVAKLKELDPKLADRYQRAVYKVQNVDKLGSFQELQALKETFELHGGPEAIEQMVEEVSAGRALEEGFDRGDPKVIDGWATDYPDGFKRLVLPASDKLLQMDAAAWENNFAAPVTVQFLDRYGVFDAIGNLGAAIRDNKPEDAAKIYNDLVSKVLKPMQGLASKARQVDPTVKTRQEELDRQAAANAETAKKNFYGGVRAEVNRQVTSTVNKELRILLGGRRITVDQGNKIRKEINSELARLTNSKQGYAKQYELVMGSNDQDRAIKFIVNKANANVSLAVRNVLRDRGMLRTAGSGGGQGGQGGSGGGNGQVRRSLTTGGGNGSGGNRGPSVVTGVRPKAGDVDFNRTDKARWVVSKGGEAWGKDGKLYKW